MGIITLLLLLFVTAAESIVCPTGQQPCGSNFCYDPTTQGCSDSGSVIQCINSCNGTCYSNSQYCYNNTKVCNNGESVCDVRFNPINGFPYGLTCYNRSLAICSDNILCVPYASCGNRCLNASNSICAHDNQTICYGYDFWGYYHNPYKSVYVCGPRKQCYDNTTHVCLNRTTVCNGLNARLCRANCYNPDSQTCVNGAVRCINSCNGTCYSNSQYCYNNTKVCNNGESVCDVRFNPINGFPYGLTCYNRSLAICSDNILCVPYASCGNRCLNASNSICAHDNQTICYGYDFWGYYHNPYKSVYVCGPRKQCYDNTTSICTGNNGTVCPIVNELCSGVCYNPQTQYCAVGNNTVFCLNNPSSVNCVPNTTITTSITTRTTSTTTVVPDSCCSGRNCTENSDCCQSNVLECQCFRHLQTDVFGSCVNPNIVPICGDSCPVQGKCKTDADCCRCQCATITFIDPDGNSVRTKQCARR